MFPRFLRPEVLPFASIEIIRAGEPVRAVLAPQPTICAYCPDFDPTAPQNRGASHGICARCQQRFDGSAVA
jgi:hypothetical protein